MLQYRIPGKEIVREKGMFIQASSRELKGFIVSNFKGSAYYKFQPNNRPRNIVHPRKIAPHNINRLSFIQMVRKVKQGIQQLGLVKLVISRVISKSMGNTTPSELFETLCEAYPSAFVYHFNDHQLGEWIGASPEILLRRVEDIYFLMSLAGTRSSAEVVNWQSKEIVEQRIVTEYIEEMLRDLQIPFEKEGPYNHAAGPVTHLRTDLWFETSKNLERQIITQLHPTPAVCGIPTKLARESLNTLEKHERELYTGIIGFFGEEQSHCYVNLRCAQVIEGVLHAYVGAGITAASDPELEWLETENKSKTLFNLLKVN